MDNNLKNIDELFSSELEGKQAMPSDNVWNAIENKLNQKELYRLQQKNKWLKKTAAALVLLLLCCLMWMYFEHQNNITQTALVQKNTISKKQLADTLNTQQHNSTNKVILNKNTTNSFYNKQVNNTNLLQTSDTRKNHSVSSKQKPTLENTTSSSLVTKNNTSPYPIKQMLNTVKKNNRKSPNKVSDADKSLHVVATRKNIYSVSYKTKYITSEKQEVRKKTSSQLIPPLTAANITISIQYARVNPLIKAPVIPSMAEPASSPAKNKNTISLSISPYFSYNFFKTNIHQGPSEHREDNRNDIKRREEKPNNNKAASFGVLATIEIAPKISIQTGVGLLSIENNINSQTLFARERRSRRRELGGGPMGGIINKGFKLNCIAGTAYFNTKQLNTNPVLGDSLQALESSSTLQYLQIPVNLEYRFITCNKWQLFGQCGLTGNLLTKGNVSTIISNGSSKEKFSATTIEGLNNIYFSLNTGVGVMYRFSKTTSFHFIPSKIVALTPINKNTPAQTYLNGFNLAGGIKLNF